MPTATTPKSVKHFERVQARVTKVLKRQAKKAAEIEGLSLSDFIAQATSDATERVLAGPHPIKLNAEESLRLAEALINPPKPSANLLAAAKRYRQFMGC